MEPDETQGPDIPVEHTHGEYDVIPGAATLEPDFEAEQTDEVEETFDEEEN